MTWFLGCHAEQSHGRISLSQRSYTKDFCAKAKCLIVNQSVRQQYPIQNSLNRTAPCSESSLQFYEQKQYRSLVDNQKYLSVVSRPDICFAIYNVAQFVSNPGKAH